MRRFYIFFMDNNITWQAAEGREMENWKKQIIMDPVLNSLFDRNTSAQDFLVSKILTLHHDHIASMYSKLSSIKHQLGASIQKQVEMKNNLIEKSFGQFMEYRNEATDSVSMNKLVDSHSSLKKFNQKYENVESGLLLWKNVTSILHFSKALEQFRVNSNILKTLMRGYNGNDETINPLKVSKIIKQLTYLSNKFDFSGISVFENQKVFIGSAKNIVQGIGSKKLTKSLIDAVNPQEMKKVDENMKNISEWIDCLINVGALRDFIASHFKTALTQLGDKIKKVFLQNIQDINANLEGILMPFMAQTCKSLIFLEEMLGRYRKSQQISTTNIPNLFLKFWEKLCQFMSQTISRAKKDQQTRNIPKNREQTLYWQYPCVYFHCSQLCTVIHQFIIQNTKFNLYTFSKFQQKLMINGILDLSTAYHKNCLKTISSIHEDLKIRDKKQTKDQATDRLQQKADDKEIMNKYCEQLKNLIKQCRTDQIFRGIIEKIGIVLREYEKQGSQKINKDKIYAIKKKVKQYIKDTSNLSISRHELQYFRINQHEQHNDEVHT